MPIPTDGTQNQDPKNVTTDKNGAEASGKKPVNPRDEIINKVIKKVSDQHVLNDEEAQRNGAAPVVDRDGTEPAGGSSADASAAKDDSTAGVAGDPADRDVGGDGEVVHPLADRILIQDGKAVVKIKVNGEERFIDADTALAAIGKHEAADARLREASEAAKQVNARAASLQAREAEVTKREQKLKTSLPLADASDPDLKGRAKSVAKALLTGTEDEVAAELEKVLVTPRQAQAPVVDENVIEQTVVKVNAKKEMVEALTKFETDFPDIKANKKLYALADAISDEVRSEHPDWNISAILAETGKRTMEFGKPAPATETKTEILVPANRQDRKRTLRPMPQSRSASQQRDVPVQAQTPAQVIAEIRKSRGQAI